MLVFIDETGDHDLQKIDPQYPLFALGALIVSEEEYLKMNDSVNALKREYFADTDGTFVLHSSELKRPFDRRSDPRNQPMLDVTTRRAFYAAFDTRVIEAHDFSVVACFIRKPEMARSYAYPADPYYFAFENLLNRILRHGGEMNVLYAEKRGEQLNTELLAEYEQLSTVGIRFYTADTVRSRTTLKLIEKRENMNGLQVIDLTLASLARSALGKEHKMMGNDVSPALIKTKYACAPTFFPSTKKPL